MLFQGELYWQWQDSGIRPNTGGTGIAGFVMKSGKAGFVSHVYNR